jgi:hypothetical protein
MKKWMLIAGLLLSGSLFFVSGILTGYSMCYDRKDKSTTSKENKKFRKSQVLKEVIDPLIGKIIDNQAKCIKSKVTKLMTPGKDAIKSARVPSDSAIQHAQKYRLRTDN